MNDTHEVISAFLDDEPFDSSRLAEALGDPAGRDLLIDLIALRHLAQTEGKEVSASTNQQPWRFLQRPSRSSLGAIAAAAAVFVALVVGYVIGERRSEVTISAAPPATRVVQAPAAWQVVPVGRMR